MLLIESSPAVSAFSYLSLCLLGYRPEAPALPTVGMTVTRYTKWSAGE